MQIHLHNTDTPIMQDCSIQHSDGFANVVTRFVLNHPNLQPHTSKYSEREGG